MIDATIPDRSDGKLTCGWCARRYHPQFLPKDGSPLTMGTPDNQCVMSLKCPRCGNNDYEKTTYITEDGKVPLTISN